MFRHTVPTPPDVRIRPASREDIPGIAAVDRSSIAEGEDVGFGAPGSTRPFADAARLAKAWHDPNRVGSEEVLVADLAGQIVGYVTLEDRGPCLELVDINVDGGHQRQGIGTRIVRAVEDRARAEGREAVTLGTSRNAQGVPWKSFPWWRSLGYRVTHEEENAWTRAIGPGTREIRMRRDLRPLGRVTLRDVGDADLPRLFEWQRDPLANAMAAFTAKDPSDWEAFREHWARIRGDRSATMQAVLLDGRLVGNVGSFLDREFGHPEVTYWIGREFWGRGLATLALAEFLRRHPARPIYARAAADNVGSIRVLEKCGFVPAGRGKGFANARGVETEEVVLKLETRR